MRIVFMGTPDFAEESLRALLEAGEDVAAVFTQPDKPRGRGMQESFSPVKTLAVERGIPVYQPATFKDGAATELLRTLAPELLVVVAYGRILPQTFLDVANTAASMSMARSCRNTAALRPFNGRCSMGTRRPVFPCSTWLRRWTPGM